MVDIANKAEGAAEQVRTQVTEGVEAVADKAQDAAEQLDSADRRILVVAAIAGITVTVTLLIRRARRR